MTQLSPSARRRVAELTDVFNDLSRRQFIRAGVAGGAGVALSAQAGAGSLSDSARSDPSGPNDLELLTLIHHATQGYSKAVYDEADALGYDAWLDRQLTPELIPDDDVEAVLAGLPTLSMTGQELWDTYVEPEYDPTIPILELRIANVIRSLWSTRQVKERVVEFWTDHFNIYQVDFGTDILKTVDDRDVIRPHALGKFRDLLRASAKSGAMMWYLDNITNFAGAPNENYAREFLELHTMGAGNGYTETDVQEFARCLTGWNIYFPDTGRYGDFNFYPSLHDQGPKTVLGLDLPGGGNQQDVELVINLVASHPATIDFVSRKLVSWLLVNDPPESVIQAVKQSWTATDGDIAAMVRVALDASSIQAALATGATKVRRPYHLLVSLVRATGGRVTDLLPMVYVLSLMGHGPYEWGPPNGYPDAVGAWAPGLSLRWLVASAYFDGYFPGLETNTNKLRNMIGGDLSAPDLAQRIDMALTGGTMSQTDVVELQAWLDAHPPTINVMREAFALAVSSPSFQQY